MNAVKEPKRGAARIPADSSRRTAGRHRAGTTAEKSPVRHQHASCRRDGGPPIDLTRIDLWARQASELPGVRTELVQRIRAEIEAGTYETPEKLDIALNRLLDELTGH